MKVILDKRKANYEQFIAFNELKSGKISFEGFSKLIEKYKYLLELKIDYEMLRREEMQIRRSGFALPLTSVAISRRKELALPEAIP